MSAVSTRSSCLFSWAGVILAMSTSASPRIQSLGAREVQESGEHSQRRLRAEVRQHINDNLRPQVCDPMTCPAL